MKKALIALILALSLSTLPLLLARADPGPMANLQVWPVGAEHTGDPIATTSPAEMFIKTTTDTNAAYDVWLLLVLNEETYNKLDRIEITNGVDVTFYHDDFAEVTEDKIPPTAPDPPYPGCKADDQYAVGSVKDKIGTTGPVYSCIKYVFDYVDTDPVFFTITVYLTEAEPNLKVLILALGTTVDGGILNEHSSWSQSSLIVIPELATILLATASLTAFGVYTLKRRK